MTVDSCSGQWAVAVEVKSVRFEVLERQFPMAGECIFPLKIQKCFIDKTAMLTFAVLNYRDVALRQPFDKLRVTAQGKLHHRQYVELKKNHDGTRFSSVDKYRDVAQFG